MSKLQELINEYCPDGVEYKSLGDLGAFYGGLSGKSKDDFKDGNAKFITYMNVYLNPSVNLHTKDKVKISPNEKQRTLQYGDIIFTGSSETPDECGISSVITEKIDEPIYLNSFCFFFRLNNPEILNPDFAKHLFRSHELRYQIGKTASGVTRFNVSKKQMEKVIIPIPPLAVQSEIVRILDHFTLLTAELTAELTARKKQYEYYRDLLLTYPKIDDATLTATNQSDRLSEINYLLDKYGYVKVKLGEVCQVDAGGTPSKNVSEYWENGDIKWLASSVCQNQKSIIEITNYITQEGLQHSSAKIQHPDTTLIAMVGATIGKVAYLNFDAATNQNVASLYPIDSSIIYAPYLYYACTTLYSKFLELGKNGFAMASLGFIRNLEIIIPRLDQQKKIASVLDRFENICTSLSTGLPAEIEARKKQYEYYRDRLLTFKAKA